MRGILFSLMSVSAALAVAPTFARSQDPGPFAASAENKFQQGRYLDSIDDYSKAIKADKRNPSFYLGKARAEMAVDRYKSAVTDSSKAIKFAPDDFQSYEVRAKAYERLKQYQKGSDDLTKLLTIKPNNGAYLLQRAQMSVELHSAKDVLKDCNQAIKTGLDRDQLASVYKMRSIAYKNLGKKAESAQEISKYNSLK